VQHPGEGLVKEDTQVMGSDGGAYNEVGVGMGWVVQGKRRHWVAKAMTSPLIAEGNQVCFVWVNAEAATGHPIDNNVEVGALRCIVRWGS
jgi:hypothetical protein